MRDYPKEEKIIFGSGEFTPYSGKWDQKIRGQRIGPVLKKRSVASQTTKRTDKEADAVQKEPQRREGSRNSRSYKMDEKKKTSTGIKRKNEEEKSEEDRQNKRRNARNPVESKNRAKIDVRLLFGSDSEEEQKTINEIFEKYTQGIRE